MLRPPRPARAGDRAVHGTSTVDEQRAGMKQSPRNDLAPVPPLGTRLLRAARLRWPLCGGGGLVRGGIKLPPRCSACRVRVERGEHDFFLGPMMFNIALAEGSFPLVLGAVIV